MGNVPDAAAEGSGVPAVLEQKTSVRCKCLCYRHIHDHAHPMRSDHGDRSPVVESSHTSLSGGTECPQTLSVPCLINRKIVFAEGIEMFKACWRERGQVCLVHGIPLSTQLVQRRLHIHRIPDDHGIS